MYIKMSLHFGEKGSRRSPPSVSLEQFTSFCRVECTKITLIWTNKAISNQLNQANWQYILFALLFSFFAFFLCPSFGSPNALTPHISKTISKLWTLMVLVKKITFVWHRIYHGPWISKAYIYRWSFPKTLWLMRVMFANNSVVRNQSSTWHECTAVRLIKAYFICLINSNSLWALIYDHTKSHWKVSRFRNKHSKSPPEQII